MEILVLGPVEASAAGRPVALAGAKQRAVLAMLALEGNATVPVDRLIEGLWGETIPASAPKMVQLYVSQLRKLLGPDGARIATRGRGYELRLGPDELDAGRAERLVEEAARGLEDGRPLPAAREALGLWRGAPLANVADEPFATTEIRRLEELRLRATELALDSDLAAGRHLDVTGELERLVAEHPLRERLHAQRMLALYRSGRQAEALDAYRAARRALVVGIGVEPGPELRRLHEKVLHQDPTLELAPPPRELPAELEPSSPILAGREEELAWLRAAWARARGGAGGAVALIGARGMGKTRLAAELAVEAHRDGGAVVYRQGTAADAAALIRRAARPTVVVLDELERATPGELASLAEALPVLAERPVLVLAAADADAETGPPALDGLPETARRVLRPLRPDAVAAIARLYGGAESAPEVVAASAGNPRRAHVLAADGARAAAARRLDAVAARAAVGRGELRVVEVELADSVVDLQAARERAARLRDEEPSGPSAPCPYKGLAPFDVADAEDFFGRERLVAELAARLVGAPLLGLVGASGSGKSSALRAGLLPALAAGVLPGSDGWRQVLLRPGPRPLRELEHAMGGLRGEERAVVAVDQCEEAFTVCDDEAERGRFLDALAAVARRAGAPAVVVLAVRADFYGRFAEHPALSALLGANHVLVGPMRRDELRRAIELPARRVGVRVEPALSDALVADAAGEAGGLPLLSAALVELWARREGRELRAAAHEATGGIRGAVARLAEAAFTRLDAGEQAVARSILLRLAGGSPEAPVRRRVPLAELDAERRTDVARVLGALAERRLLTLADGTVEVAHEALLREWPRLRGWLEEDAEGRRLHAHLIAAAQEWDAAGREEEELYRGARLAAVLDWAAGHEGELNTREREFVVESRALGERETARTRRANQRLRGLVAGVGLLLAAALVAGAVALGERGNARREAVRADAQRLGAQALVEDDLDRGLLLARQGVALDATVETRGNLLAGLLRSPAAIAVLQRPGSRLLAIALSPDGRTLAVGDHRHAVVLIDRLTRRRLGRVHIAPGTVQDLAFSPDGTRLAVAAAGRVGYEMQLLDGRDGTLVAHVGRRANHVVRGVSFSPDGRTLQLTSTAAFETAPRGVLERFDGRTGAARGGPSPLGPGVVTGGLPAFTRDGRQMVTATDAGDVVVRDARTLRGLRRFPVRAVVAALAPDGGTLAVGLEDGGVRFLDLVTGRVRTAAGRHGARVMDARFTRDGRTLVTAGDDGDLIVWDAAQAAAGETLAGHAGRVTSLALDAPGTTAYSASLDGSLIAWDLVGDRRLGRPFRTGAGNPFWPSFGRSPDGRTLAVPEAGGAVNLIDTRTLTRRARLRGSGPLHGAVFSPDGRRLATPGMGIVTLWDLRGGGRRERVLRGHEAEVTAAVFSRDGRTLLTASYDGTVRTWGVRSGAARGAPLRFPAGINDIGLSPDGRFLAVTLHARGETHVVDLARRERLAHVREREETGTAQFSPDGRLLATAGVAGVVHIVSTDTWRPTGRPLTGHVGWIMSVAWSPDGRTLVTGGSDGTARLWDVRTGRQIGAPLPGEANQWNTAQFAPSGTHVFAVYVTGRAVRWDVRPAAWARQACRIAGRALTRAEWAEYLPGRPYAPACA